nr:hypothetical protein GCM10020185_12350 [Pseudomonas brassicacearum subsp. brassicacearum]
MAEMNDYQFKIVRLEGEFIWHTHADTDETFIVLEGELRIDFRDGAVTIGPGEMYVVKKRCRAQAQRRTRSETAADRTPWCPQYRRGNQRANGGQ